MEIRGGGVMAGYTAVPGLLYIVSIRSRNIASEVRVNDVLIDQCDGHVPETYTEKVNPLLLRGGNTLAASLGNAKPAPTETASKLPPGEQPPPADPEFRLTLRRGRQGVNPAESSELAAFAWPPATVPLSPSGLVEVYRQVVEVSDLPYEAQWLRAEPTAMGDDQAHDYVRRYADLMRRREFSSVVAANRFKLEELSRCFGLDARELMSDMQEHMATLAAAGDYEVREAEGLTAVREGGGRMVTIVGRNRTAPIAVRSSGVEFPFPLHFAYVGSHWQIVR